MPAVVRAGRVGGEVLGIRTDTAAFRRDKRLDDTFRSIDRPAGSRPPTQPLNFRRDAYTRQAAVIFVSDLSRPRVYFCAVDFI